MITIYTKQSCPWCQKTKEFFKANNVKYKEKDVEKDEKAAKEMFELSGQPGVPVINTGDEIIVGFDEAALKEAIKK
ncbi:MAG: NrdH-redoxin [Nanoarchaeota archaeon]|nr:NrdH-redoxin [Nanoarchaeota archaeon]|tara:strand:- start:1037 stop:1264 length:228 start_codon:yes stop_codon:yes gene_type:complete